MIADRYRVAGANVVIADLPEAIASIARDGLGARVRAATLDVTSPREWAATMVEIVDRAGRLDVLVNCAGVVSWTLLEDTAWEEYQRVVAVNQGGVFLGMKAAIEPMRLSGGGSIINLSSIAGLTGVPAFSYSASKWAIRGMTKSAALTLARYDIRVNSIHPGPTDTPMIADRLTPSGRRLADDPSAVPLGRVGVPADVAGLALFLGTDDAAFITGAEFVIDGGQTLGAGLPPLPRPAK